jgi:hypothetical protein
MQFLCRENFLTFTGFERVKSASHNRICLSSGLGSELRAPAVMARSHSALRSATSRGQPPRERSAATSAASHCERCQPLRANVGRKVESIINAGSVHTARDV